MERVDGPGLGGWELSLLSESSEDMVNRLPLDLDWADFDRRIWLWRRLSGGVGGRFGWELLRWSESAELVARRVSEETEK